MVQTRGLVVWFTGLSGAGKSTLARSTATLLRENAIACHVLDADDVRRQLCPDLGFSEKDRKENVRRMGYVAGLLAENGIVVLAAAISPSRSARDELRHSLPSFAEVFVDAPLAVCQSRDPVGLYRRFHQHEVKNMAGIDLAYEPPLVPEIHCCTDKESIAESVSKICDWVVRSRESNRG